MIYWAGSNRLFWIIISAVIAYWLFKKLIAFRKPPTRTITRLHGAGDELQIDATTEVIETKVGPLKAGQRRLTVRDPRLLPKNKARGQMRASLRLKRKQVMSKEEGSRLFGATLRTRHRGIRDLATDEEQLKRINLPDWKTEDELAAALGITRRQLWFFSMHRERELHPHYVTFAIPKRSGGRRLIMAPKRGLKAIHRKLLTLLVEKLPVSEHAHGFRKGRGVKSGAEVHVGYRHVLRIDLKDFFPTMTFARVRGYLIAMGYSYPVAATLAVLMTEAERQPVQIDGKIYHVPVGQRHCVQGAPTSPGMCNAIVQKLDHRLAGLARKHQLTYTRYADDLTFSGNVDRSGMLHFLKLARWIVHEEGFVPNDTKTRLASQGRRQIVTGAVVNQTLGLSRQERRQMRAMAHRLTREPENAELEQEFQGKLAWLNVLNREQANKLRARVVPGG